MILRDQDTDEIRTLKLREIRLTAKSPTEIVTAQPEAVSDQLSSADDVTRTGRRILHVLTQVIFITASEMSTMLINKEDKAGRLIFLRS